MTQNKTDVPAPKTRQQYNKLIKKANGLYARNDYTDALRHFTRALDYKDYHPNILINISRCLFNLGMKNKAIAFMEHALDQSAGDAAICDSLGNACVAMDFHELAVKFYKIYVQLCPDQPLGYNNLATALRENGQIDESIQMLQDIIPLYPENALLWNTLGAGVSFRDGYPAALPFYEEAFRLDPTIHSVASNLCLTYTNLGQYEKALEFAHKAVEISKISASYRALTHSSFRLGKFDEAFTGLAWHNHASDPGSVFMPYKIDKWQGQDLKGKTILIGAEQGVGDEILFASLYPMLIEEAKQVIIGCDKRLVPLFRNSFPKATILPYVSAQHDSGYRLRLYEGLNPESIDYMCLYMELLRYRWRSVDDIPDMSDGYLTPDPEKVSYWQDKLAKLPHDINIGLCWRSGITQAKRSMFYATLLEWAPVLATRNINFINVQYGDCDEEIKELLAGKGLTLHDFEELDLKDDFEGTAALMKNLDLVIGPASAPLPLAASMGIQTWWLTYNSRPWWSFGYENGSPLYKKALMAIKPPALDWDNFLSQFAAQEFSPWVAEKLK